MGKYDDLKAKLKEPKFIAEIELESDRGNGADLYWLMDGGELIKGAGIDAWAEDTSIPTTRLLQEVYLENDPRISVEPDYDRDSCPHLSLTLRYPIRLLDRLEHKIKSLGYFVSGYEFSEDEEEEAA